MLTATAIIALLFGAWFGWLAASDTYTSPRVTPRSLIEDGIIMTGCLAVIVTALRVLL